MNIVLSKLPHTWLIDVDGTILKHNGHKQEGDSLLPGVREFWSQIPQQDIIILMTARTEAETPETLEFLRRNGLRFDQCLFGLPTGERVLVNDVKPSGLTTAFAINLERDTGLQSVGVEFDDR